MKDYGPTRDFATKLLTKFGAPLTFRVTDNAGAVTNVEVVGVKTERVRQVSGESNIQVGDWVVLLAAQPLVPLEGMRVNLSGTWHVVVRVEAVQPADIVVCWKIWARIG